MRYPQTFPITAVLSLLILAALACSIDVSTAHFDNPRLYEDPNGESSTRSYAPDDTFYGITTLRDADDDTEVRAEWQRVITEDDGSARAEIIAEETLTTGSTRLTFVLAPDPVPWAKGDYRLRLYLDSDHKETLEFSVK